MYYTMRERRALHSSLAPKCNIFVRQLHGMLHKCLPENKPGFWDTVKPGILIGLPVWAFIIWILEKKIVFSNFGLPYRSNKAAC